MSIQKKDYMWVLYIVALAIFAGVVYSLLNSGIVALVVVGWVVFASVILGAVEFSFAPLQTLWAYLKRLFNRNEKV